MELWQIFARIYLFIVLALFFVVFVDVVLKKYWRKTEDRNLVLLALVLGFFSLCWPATITLNLRMKDLREYWLEDIRFYQRTWRDWRIKRQWQKI